MKYKITIESIEEVVNDKYPKTEKIYEQVVESISVSDIAKTVNGIE